MKIAIATENGTVAAHFGRCPEYTVAVIEDGTVTERDRLPNPGHAPGVIPRFLKDHGVDAIIAGGMGGRAQALFDEIGIEHVVGVVGSVESVLQGCLDGTLEGGESLCSHGESHGDGSGNCGPSGHGHGSRGHGSGT